MIGRRRGFTDVTKACGTHLRVAPQPDVTSRNGPRKVRDHEVRHTAAWSRSTTTMTAGATSSSATVPTRGSYRNNRDGTFEDVTHLWGCPGEFPAVASPSWRTWTITATASCSSGSPPGLNWLFRNDGGRTGFTFTDVTETANLGGFWVAMASAADYDNDGKVDLYLGATRPAQERAVHPFLYAQWRGEFAPPQRGRLRFRDVTDSAGVREGGLTLGIAGATMTATASWISSSPTTSAATPCSATTATARSPMSQGDDRAGLRLQHQRPPGRPWRICITVALSVMSWVVSAPMAPFAQPVAAQRDQLLHHRQHRIADALGLRFELGEIDLGDVAVPADFLAGLFRDDAEPRLRPRQRRLEVEIFLHAVARRKTPAASPRSRRCRGIRRSRSRTWAWRNSPGSVSSKSSACGMPRIRGAMTGVIGAGQARRSRAAAAFAGHRRGRIPELFRRGNGAAPAQRSRICSAKLASTTSCSAAPTASAPRCSG